MDVTQALKDAENSLRDFLQAYLYDLYGKDWLQYSGISPERVAQWTERKVTSSKQLGATDERLIYYADFYDLKTLIHKNWNAGIKDVFGDKKETEVFLSCLERYRNPDAHRRELFAYQKALVLGISGDLRSKVIRYRCSMDGPGKYYAQIESVQDNLGNSWAAGQPKTLVTPHTLRPGQRIEFVITANDPRGEKLEYIVLPTQGPKDVAWQSNGNCAFTVTIEHLFEDQWLNMAVRTNREFHPKYLSPVGKVDDIVKFRYAILPPEDH